MALTADQRHQLAMLKIERERKLAQLKADAIKAQAKKEADPTNSLTSAGAALAGQYAARKAIEYSPQLADLVGAGTTAATTAGTTAATQAATQVGSQAAGQGAGMAMQVGADGGSGLMAGLPSAPTVLGGLGAAYGLYSLGKGIQGKAGRKAGAMSGAGAGAGIGTMILPGAGTAIGALVGAGLGAVSGNIRSGKGQKQQVRDAAREQLQSALGLSGNNFNLSKADGSGFDLGLDGHADWVGSKGNKLHAYDMDMQNPLSAQAAGYANSIGALSGIDGSQVVSQLGRGLMDGATDEEGIKQNAVAALKQMGLSDLDSALTKFRASYQGPNAAAYENGLRQAFAPHQQQRPQQGQPQQPQQGPPPPRPSQQGFNPQQGWKPPPPPPVPPQGDRGPGSFGNATPPRNFPAPLTEEERRRLMQGVPPRQGM